MEYNFDDFLGINEGDVSSLDKYREDKKKDLDAAANKLKERMDAKRRDEEAQNSLKKKHERPSNGVVYRAKAVGEASEEEMHASTGDTFWDSLYIAHTDPEEDNPTEVPDGERYNDTINHGTNGKIDDIEAMGEDSQVEDEPEHYYNSYDGDDDDDSDEITEVPLECKESYSMSREYQDIIQEYFDLSDYQTFDFLTSIDEAEQSKTINSLTSKLYDIIVAKSTEVDYGSIPASKGDITQIQGYGNLLECLAILKGILVEYRQDLSPINIVQEAISNIQNRTDIFEKGFNLDIDFICLIYNNIVLAIVSSISLLLATSIEFIKDAGEDLYSIKLDRVAYNKSKDGVLFDSLKKFNKSCTSGEMDKALDHIINQAKKQFAGGIAALTFVGVIAGAAIVLNIVPIMREIVFFFYNARQSVADYFLIQADVIQMNAERVKNNDYSEKSAAERKVIAKKQQKFAEKYRKIGNSIAVKSKSGEAGAKKSSGVFRKKYRATSSDNEENLDSYKDNSDNTQSALF